MRASCSQRALAGDFLAAGFLAAGFLAFFSPAGFLARGLAGAWTATVAARAAEQLKRWAAKGGMQEKQTGRRPAVAQGRTVLWCYRRGGWAAPPLRPAARSSALLAGPAPAPIPQLLAALTPKPLRSFYVTFILKYSLPFSTAKITLRPESGAHLLLLLALRLGRLGLAHPLLLLLHSTQQGKGTGGQQARSPQCALSAHPGIARPRGAARRASTQLRAPQLRSRTLRSSPSL